MLYGILNARNPDAEVDCKFLQELQDLYEGGYSILRRASAYLPRFTDESDQRYKERCQLTSYISYLGQIVDSYAAHLFGQELVIQPAADADNPDTPGVLPDVDYYTTLAANVDLKGTRFVNLVRCAFSTALVKRRAYVAIDFPALEDMPANLADEDALGAARGYAFEVPNEMMMDWCYDQIVRVRKPISKDSKDTVDFEVGRFKWVILKRCRDDRDSPDSMRGMVVEEFKIWRRDDDGSVIWERYETPPFDPTKQCPKDTDDLPLVASGKTSFREIPIVELCLPHGLWIGNKVGPLNREHYRRRSALIAAQQMGLYEIPTVFLGSEMGAPGGAVPSEISTDASRGDDPVAQLHARGFMALGAQDKFEFVGPSGSAFKITSDQLEGLVDEIFRTAHQMAASISSTANAVGRSGASKAEDRNSTQIILGAYGAIARTFALRIYQVISEARGEDVVWTAHGLDRFELYDRTEVLAEALQVDAIPIPSRTFKVAYLTQVAQRLVPNLPAETQQTIQREIDKGTQAEVSLNQAMNGAPNPIEGAIMSAAATGKDGIKPGALLKPNPAAEQPKPAPPQGGNEPPPQAPQAPPTGQSKAAPPAASKAPPAAPQAPGKAPPKAPPPPPPSPTVAGAEAPLRNGTADQFPRINLPTEVLAAIAPQEIGECAGFKVELVDGIMLRALVDIDFAYAGNPARYAYIPDSTIWVEKVQPPIEVACDLVHEIIECVAMRSEGLGYDDAHEMRANTAERMLRTAIAAGDVKVSTNSTALMVAEEWIKDFINGQQDEDSPESSPDSDSGPPSSSEDRGDDANSAPGSAGPSTQRSLKRKPQGDQRGGKGA